MATPDAARWSVSARSVSQLPPRQSAARAALLYLAPEIASQDRLERSASCTSDLSMHAIPLYPPDLAVCCLSQVPHQAPSVVKSGSFSPSPLPGGDSGAACFTVAGEGCLRQLRRACPAPSRGATCRKGEQLDSGCRPRAVQRRNPMCPGAALLEKKDVLITKGRAATLPAGGLNTLPCAAIRGAQLVGFGSAPFQLAGPLQERSVICAEANTARAVTGLRYIESLKCHHGVLVPGICLVKFKRYTNRHCLIGFTAIAPKGQALV